MDGFSFSKCVTLCIESLHGEYLASFSLEIFGQHFHFWMWICDVEPALLIIMSEFQRGSLSLLRQLENSAALFICRSTLQPLITLFFPVIFMALLHLLSRMRLGKAARWDLCVTPLLHLLQILVCVMSETGDRFLLFSKIGGWWVRSNAC